MSDIIHNIILMIAGIFIIVVVIATPFIIHHSIMESRANCQVICDYKNLTYESGSQGGVCVCKDEINVKYTFEYVS
jgi:hypothetical protein